MLRAAITCSSLRPARRPHRLPTKRPRRPAATLTTLTEAAAAAATPRTACGSTLAAGASLPLPLLPLLPLSTATIASTPALEAATTTRARDMLDFITARNENCYSGSGEALTAASPCKQLL